MKSIQLVLCATLGLALLACNENEQPQSCDGPQVFFQADSVGDGTAAENWLLFPFPSNHRMTLSGGPDMSDFPNPNDVSLIDDYGDTIQDELSGFSTNGAVHMRFTEPLNTASLPQNADAYLADNAPLQLLDITESSPEYGQARPLRWEYVSKDGTFVAKNSLAVAPAWGFVLRENTTYALMVTNAVKTASGAELTAPGLLQEALGVAAKPGCTPAKSDANAAVFQSFAPLRAYLAASGKLAQNVVAATVFTTQDITQDLGKLYRQVQEAAAPAYNEDWQNPRNPATGQPSNTLIAEGSRVWQAPNVTAEFWVMQGQVTLPNYQAGRLPYAEPRHGGGLRFDDQGEPIIQRQETVRFVLTLPKDGPAFGECFPVVQYAHGTGGSANSFISDGTAGRLAGRRIAGISIDQPMHGPRSLGESFDVDLMSFNYFNPQSARMNFRQSAVDTFALTRFIKSSLQVPAAQSPTGENICFDADRVSFFGHSHGGLSGALAAAYDDSISAYMLSGAGGGLSITVFEREDVDIASLISELLELSEDETLTELHPVITLVQTIVDVTDPINYAPYWSHFQTHSAPKSVLVSSGELDNQTPHRTAAAMTVAARIPNTLPVVLPVVEYDYLGMSALDASGAGFSNNITNGVTSGIMQYRSNNSSNSASHFLIFYRPEAIGAAMRFLESASYESTTVIARDPQSLAR